MDTHTRTHTHTRTEIGSILASFLLVFLLVFFWIFFWTGIVRIVATTKRSFWGRVEERIDLHCCCVCSTIESLKSLIGIGSIEEIHTHTYNIDLCAYVWCTWLSTLLTRQWVGSFHAGLHKENDLWHVIRHAVGQVDAEVNREIYGTICVCLAWQYPKRFSA